MSRTYSVVQDRRVACELSVVIPAFNTGNALAALLVEIVERAAKLAISTCVVVVDDGSEDGSTYSLPDVAHLSILRGPNQGKGSAVIAGMEFCSSRVCAFVDGDGAYDAATLFSVCAPVLKHSASVAIGVRPRSRRFQRRALLSRLFSYLVKKWYGLDFDTQAGVKAFDHKVLDPALRTLQVEGFSFDVKMLTFAREVGAWPPATIPVTPRITANSTVNVRRSTRALIDLYRGRIR